MAGARVNMDSSGSIYAKVFGPGSGPERHARGLAARVGAAARAGAPVGDTGRLKASVYVNQNRTERGRFSFGFDVGASVYYAGFVHEGTGPRRVEVYPHKMKFIGTNLYAGQRISTHVVNHPGNTGQPFLQRALTAMGA